MNSVLCFSYTRGVRLSPSTAAPNGHVVPAPDERWVWSICWMMRGWGNRSSSAEKPALSSLVPLDTDSETASLRDEKPAWYTTRPNTTPYFINSDIPCLLLDIYSQPETFIKHYCISKVTSTFPFGIVIGYGPDGPEFEPRKKQKFFFSPKHSDRLWTPPSLQFNEYRGFFCGGRASRSKLTTHLHIMLRFRTNGVIPLLPPYMPIYIVGRGKALPFRTTIESR
jgi:hypothetical protein